MDIARAARSDLGSLPEYIITNFIPGAQPFLQRYPRIIRVLGAVLAIWYFGPLDRLKALWSRFAQFLISTVTISSEEDLFQYLVAWISDKKTLRADQTLNAITNTPAEESRRRRRFPHDPDMEEMARKPTEDPKIKYEQSQGMQIFIHNRRIFFVKRTAGEGHTYSSNRYKRTEILNISCFGRSPQPIKDLIEEVFQMNKDKERTMTIIRRPFTGGYSSRLSWSRLTAKPRRALDTVILDPGQKQSILKDIEEYMDESTQNFYGDHGIPYRRGYLFYGPPGCGKTSFCLALASKFNLDVYVLTLLDHELQDSDLMSLMNQLPSPSLLLLEDIDTAGLSRKKPFADTAGPSLGGMFGGGGRRGMRRGLPQGAVAAASSTNKAEPNLDSDDEDTNKQATRVSLSGLLNAIDGVAAPEGHILIMTTNKPHELDDALVRAGRISVKVAFMNASQQQAEEIFLRMYVDLPQPGLAASAEKSSSPDTKDLAKQFADQIPDGEFSPADLQDYLLVHKKDPEGAVRDLKRWMEDQHEERKRKEQEKEAEIRYKAQKAERRRRQFREDMKAALADEKKKVEGEDDGAAADDESKGDEDDEKKEAQQETVDDRPINEQLRDAERQITTEDRARP
ncbi:hypothetical protein PMZ80_008985 [Knufia obscura]|uniref:Uncharacterized protein n=2 Tax=Knufia TaxID=430999 RepID=A0AAN8EN17_9EURO|nr:hypothetical protein PMZ80_008985 [Knufia obscura]KAK5955058.1 hypothetical protein OHC33_003737 [Knufia fluminis]